MHSNRMKWLKTTSLLVVCAVSPWLSSEAQTNLDSASQPKRDGVVVSPEKLTVNDASPTANLRPSRVERQKLPPEVQQRIDRFRHEARIYLNQQEQLKKQLEGANDQERAIIREKLKALREQWLEKSREMRKQLRERQQELMDKLPDYREVIESARNAAQEQAQQAQQDTRKRRGED